MLWSVVAKESAMNGPVLGCRAFAREACVKACASHLAELLYMSLSFMISALKIFNSVCRSSTGAALAILFSFDLRCASG